MAGCAVWQWLIVHFAKDVDLEVFEDMHFHDFLYNGIDDSGLCGSIGPPVHHNGDSD